MQTFRVSAAVLLRVTDGARFALLDKEGSRKLGAAATTLQVTEEGRQDLWEKFSVTPKDFLDDGDKLRLLLPREHFAEFCRWVRDGEGIKPFVADPRFREKLRIWELDQAISRLKPWKYRIHEVPGQGPLRGEIWMRIVFKIYEVRFTSEGLERFAHTNSALELVTAGHIYSGISPERRLIPGVWRVLL